MDETNTIASNGEIAANPNYGHMDGTSFATNHAVIGSTQSPVTGTSEPSGAAWASSLRAKPRRSEDPFLTEPHLDAFLNTPKLQSPEA
jgi:hypothetical protein